MWKRMVPSVKAGLDMATTVAVLAAASTVLWMAATGGFVPEPTGPATYKVGDKFDAVAGAQVTSPERPTLVMHLSSRCQYCTASLGFYRALAEANRTARIVVVGSEAAEQLKVYVESAGFYPDAIVRVAPGTLKMPSTPTLALVDTTGTVAGIWRGRLKPELEQQVRARLGLE